MAVSKSGFFLLNSPKKVIFRYFILFCFIPAILHAQAPEKMPPPLNFCFAVSEKQFCFHFYGNNIFVNLKKIKEAASSRKLTLIELNEYYFL